MKLEWTIQYGRLIADRFESIARNVRYVIEPDEKGWGAKAIRVCDGMTRIDRTPTRMLLQELVEWCEEDAERPAECPPQAVSAEPGASTATGGMSGRASVFHPEIREVRPNGWRNDEEYAKHFSTFVGELLWDRLSKQFCILRAYDPNDGASAYAEVVGPVDGDITGKYVLIEMSSTDRAWMVAGEGKAPGFGYEEAPVVKGDLRAAVSFLKKQVGELAEKQKADDEIRFTQIQLILQRMNQNNIKVSGGFERLKERMEFLQQRTDGLDGPGLAGRLLDLEQKVSKFLELNPTAMRWRINPDGGCTRVETVPTADLADMSKRLMALEQRYATADEARKP